jgi:hypothetical protein
VFASLIRRIVSSSRGMMLGVDRLQRARVSPLARHQMLPRRLRENSSIYYRLVELPRSALSPAEKPLATVPAAHRPSHHHCRHALKCAPPLGPANLVASAARANMRFHGSRDHGLVRLPVSRIPVSALSVSRLTILGAPRNSIRLLRVTSRLKVTARGCDALTPETRWSNKWRRSGQPPHRR